MTRDPGMTIPSPAIKDAGVYLVAICALAKSDIEGRRALQRQADDLAEEVLVVAVDPEDWSKEAKEKRQRRIPKVPRGRGPFCRSFLFLRKMCNG